MNTAQLMTAAAALKDVADEKPVGKVEFEGHGRSDGMAHLTITFEGCQHNFVLNADGKIERTWKLVVDEFEAHQAAHARALEINAGLPTNAAGG